MAQVVANYLRCHPAVESVRYPGLRQDPDYEVASHTMIGGFGPLVRYCVAGEWHELECEDEDPRKAVMRLETRLASLMER